MKYQRRAASDEPTGFAHCSSLTAHCSDFGTRNLRLRPAGYRGQREMSILFAYDGFISERS